MIIIKLIFKTEKHCMFNPEVLKKTIYFINKGKLQLARVRSQNLEATSLNLFLDKFLVRK